LLEVNLNSHSNILACEEPPKKVNKTEDQVAVSSLNSKGERIPLEVNHDDKCPFCKYTFLDPRLLPCDHVICFFCINLIKDENINNECECPVCHEIHSYLDQENPRVEGNQPIETNLHKEDKMESQGEKHLKDLKNLFEKIRVKMDNFSQLLAHPEVEIKKHFDSLRLEVDLVTEKVIARARTIHDEFFSTIDECESQCLANLTRNAEAFNQKKLDYEALNIKFQIIEEYPKLEHLRKAKPRSIDLQREILKSNLNLKTIDSNVKSVNSLLFEWKKFEFLPDADIDGKQLLGKFRIEPICKDLNKIFIKKRKIICELPKNDKIHLVEYLPKSHSYAVLTTNMGQAYVNLIDDRKCGFLLKRVTFLQSKNIKERNAAFHSSVNSESRIVFSIQVRNSPQEVDSYYFFLFDENLNLLASQEMINSDLTSIVSISLNESSHTYTLWRSAEKRSYLTVYDDKLNYLNTLGMFSKRLTDPFYLPSNLETIQACHGKLVLFGSQQVKTLNENSGLVESVYDMSGAKRMWVYQNTYLITFDDKRTFLFFDLTNIRSKKGFLRLNNDAFDYKHKHVSNEKLLLFNEDSYEMQSFD